MTGSYCGVISHATDVRAGTVGLGFGGRGDDGRGDERKAVGSDVGGVILEPAARSFLDHLSASVAPPAPGRRASGTATDEHWITVGNIHVRVVRPHRDAPSPPAVLYLHGGVRYRGTADTHRRIADELADQAGAVVLVPEHTAGGRMRYPESRDRMYELTRWLVDNAASVDVDPTRLAVVGDSVGGTLAIAVTFRAVQRGEFGLRHLVVFYPATDAAGETLSHNQFADDYYLRRADMRDFWDSYAPSAHQLRPEVSPLQANSWELIGFPPSLIITAEADVLRDEGESFAAKLRAARVPTTAVRYEGMIHDFVVLDELADTVGARAATSQAAAALRDAFGQGAN